MNKNDLTRKFREDTDKMIMLCITLPKAMKKVKELEEIIAECEEEESEVWKWYNSRVFHIRGRADKAKLDSVVRKCQRTIIDSKREKNRILEQIEVDTGEKLKSADDIREILFKITIIIAELMGQWSATDVVIDEYEKKVFGCTSGANSFVREKDCQEEKRVDLYKQIKIAEEELQKQKSEHKERDKSDKDWDR